MAREPSKRPATSPPWPRLPSQEVLFGALYCLLLTCIAGGLAWWVFRSSIDADHEYKCAKTVTAMKATAEDVRPRPPGGWPDGAEGDLSSRFPYLADMLEQAGCPDTLAKLRQGLSLQSSPPSGLGEIGPNQ
jgi:hypothetical protein